MIAPRFGVSLDQINVPKTRRRFKNNTQKLLLRAGIVVEKRMKKLLSVGGYKGKGKNRTYSPSEPGQPPHLQTGNLRSSVTTAWDPTTESVVIGPTRFAWYGVVHEYGGRYHPKRPFAMPALLQSLRDIRKAMGGTE